MTVRVLNNVHERALDLILQARTESLSEQNHRWLASHLQDCFDCQQQYEAVELAIKGVRAETARVTATCSLVRATQILCRERATELQQNDERMKPLWIACAVAAAWVLASLPIVWEGFGWIGQHAELPSIIWQSAAVCAWLMPTALIAALMISWRQRTTATTE